MPAELTVRCRIDLEVDEASRLAFCALPSTAATHRHAMTEAGQHSDQRTAFQRDRDRIVHSRAFRRLKHKTQVYVPHTGDHPRTRLTHTLEVAQLARTIARALALNEDLTEAIALAHDLGHTPFGHSGERALARICAGVQEGCSLPDSVTAELGTFKHNYQSVRVIDLLEHRYDHPGINLSDQVREGVLKHTTWKVDFPFPLPTTDGLRLGLPCHLEGQVVALADEIAQQTHDLEDGLANESVQLSAIERLRAAGMVIARLGEGYTGERHRGRRAALLQRGLIDLLIEDAITATATAVTAVARRLAITTREDWHRHADEIPAATVALSAPVAEVFAELKAFVYRFIINHQEVNRQDWRATLVVSQLFRAYYQNPLTLPTYALLRFAEVSGRSYLRDVEIRFIPEEVRTYYQPDPRFARIIVDHLAGMSDRFALEEHEALYHPHAAL